MTKMLRLGFALLLVCLLVFTGIAPAFAATYKFIYNFSDQNVLNDLLPYYQSSSESGTGVSESLDKHWIVEGKGVLTRVNDLGGADVGTSYAELYLKQKFINFEIVYDMKVPAGTRGWVGIMFGKQDMKATFFSDGDGAFMNTEVGSAFFWGQTTGGPEGSNAGLVGNYLPGEWNFVKVKVFTNNNGNRRVEYYVNNELIIANNAQNATIHGNVCLFTTTGTASFRNMAVNYLDANGNVASSDITAPPVNPPAVTPPAVDLQPVKCQFNYDFSNEEVRNSMQPYFQRSAQSGTGAKEDFSAHWTVDKKGVLTRVNDLGAQDLGATYAELYFDRVLTNFELNYDMQAPAGAHGWVGIMYGKKDKSASFFSEGDGVFINTEVGTAFFWGQTVGNPEGTNVADVQNYVVGGWNRVRVKVFTNQDGVRVSELYVNGVKLLSNTANTGTITGSVCLFTTSGAASFCNVGINYLNASGEVIDHIPADKVEITNKITAAQIDDTMQLQATVSPEDTSDKELVYSSSDLSVAIVSPEGKVTFISSGNVVITAMSKDNPAAQDTMEVTVAPKLTKVQINNKISGAKTGETYALSVSSVPGDAQVVFLYTSSDETIATVSPQGQITFLKAGEVVITVACTEDSSIVDVMKVTVEGKTIVPGTPDGENFAGWVVAIIVVVVIAVTGVVLLLRRKSKKAE